MYSSKYLIMTGFLVLFANFPCSIFPVVHSKYPSVDEKCNVYFNYTRYWHDKQDVLFQKYEICWNDTLKETGGRNLTDTEKYNCQWKCVHIAEGSASEDGTFNSKFLDVVKAEYKKYSNATVAFINNLVNTLSTCAKQAVDKFKTLETDGKNEFVPGECQMHGHYHDCTRMKFRAPVNNATKVELCGEE